MKFAKVIYCGTLYSLCKVAANFPFFMERLREPDLESSVDVNGFFVTCSNRDVLVDNRQTINKANYEFACGRD